MLSMCRSRRDREDIMSVLRTLAVAAAALAAATLGEARSAMAADGDKLERSVSVSASGTVTAEPDIAQISAGVTTDGDTAKDAIARNNAVMAKLIDGLKAGGIGARDIQTTTLHVEPRYSQPKDGRPGTISGYRVVNQVRLTVREVKRLGDLLDQAIALGANQINSIGFDIAEGRGAQASDGQRQAPRRALCGGGGRAARAGAAHLRKRRGDCIPTVCAGPGDGGLRAHRGRHAYPFCRGARHLRAALSLAFTIGLGRARGVGRGRRRVQSPAGDDGVVVGAEKRHLSLHRGVATDGQPAWARR
jgi:uncharacterized protein YggE